MKWKRFKKGYVPKINNHEDQKKKIFVLRAREGSVRVCGDGDLLNFWCGFAEIFILICCIAVLQNQPV